ncbi:MAG: PHP domain-containing protein [Bacteroidota bacterium]
MLTAFTADLHMHTCLSPCGDLLMSPKKITARVLERSLDIIAITDHNSVENAQAVMKAAAGMNVVVLPGMEVCTREEIHVLAIFENLKSALELQDIVYAHLTGENDPEVFGEQIVANENDEVEGSQKKFFIGAVDLPLEELEKSIHRLNGMVIASHIDRESYSVIGQLGFLPETARFDALEISSNISDTEAEERFKKYRGHTFIRNSDAHSLDDIGKNTSKLLMERPSFTEVRMALRNENGRAVIRYHA